MISIDIPYYYISELQPIEPWNRYEITMKSSTPIGERSRLLLPWWARTAPKLLEHGARFLATRVDMTKDWEFTNVGYLLGV